MIIAMTFAAGALAARGLAGSANNTRAVLLPSLTRADVRRVVENVDASVSRETRLVALRDVSPSVAAALAPPRAYAAAALERPRRPPPFSAEFPATAGCAILMGGQVRSFLSMPVQRFWRLWMASAGPDKPIVFGALDLLTMNRGDMVGLLDWKLTERLVDASTIERAFKDLGITYVAAWDAARAAELRAKGAVDMELHSAMVQDIPGFRDLLGDAKRPEKSYLYRSLGGIYLGYAKKLIAFAALLRWERKNRQSFAHVVSVRPDVVYPAVLAKHAGVSFFARLRGLDGVAFVANDVFGAMPRSHAFSYCSSFAFIRLKLELDSPVLDAGPDGDYLYIAVGMAGALVQHTNMFAYDGLLFAGGGFEYDGGRSAASLLLADGAPLVNFAHGGHPFLREFDVNGSVCVGSSPEARTLAQAFDLRVHVCNMSSPRPSGTLRPPTPTTLDRENARTQGPRRGPWWAWIGLVVLGLTSLRWFIGGGCGAENIP